MPCYTRSRTLLTAATALTLTGALATGPPTADAAPTPGTRPDVRLAAPPGQVVRSATVRLGADRLHAVGRGSLSERLSTTAYSMVGFTWRGTDPHVTLRTRTGRTWTSWRSVPLLTDGRAADGRAASSLLWVDRSQGIQVRTGRKPRALDLVLINPGELSSDHLAGDTPAASSPRLARTTTTSAPRPRLHTRKEWGANPAWRNGKPFYLHLLKQVHVHHTATGNDYTRADVPGILRGIYRYHTQTLGWFDIGYNFLVDRFGRAWVGRSGGADRLVRGAHTLGFNHASVGIAVIGNLATRQATPETVTTIVRLAAWKLDKYGRAAEGNVTITSSGSDKYPKGTTVRLPAIDGHRDTNDTECPGLVYDQLPRIRSRTQARIDRF